MNTIFNNCKCDCFSMFPFGHVGFTAFFANLLSLNIIFAVIGSQIPDIIDKPLNIIGVLPNSRNIGHTLFMSGLIFISSYVITKKKDISFSLSFLSLIHLFNLFHGTASAIRFYHFIGYTFPHQPFSVKYSFIWFSIDLIGLFLLFYVYQCNSKFRKKVSDIIKSVKSKLKL